MSKMQKYPCIVNRNGQAPKEYIGIMFNGDQNFYHKEVVNALKKSGAEKELIKAVKAADGDIEISKILIEANQFDVLVNVFNDIDSRTVVLDYLDELYQNAVKDAFSCIENNFSKKLSKLGKNPKIEEVLAEVDQSIADTTEEICKKMVKLHDKKASEIMEKYYEACRKKLRRLKEEIKAVQEEKRRLEEIIHKIS